jgi:protein-S-isoprenylcysteine O-methyltransferase Ste14
MKEQQSNKTGKLDQIRQVIKTRLDEGETAQMIYKDLASTFGSDAKYERIFSRLVGSTSSQATQEANKTLHQAVVVGFVALMVCYVIYTFRYMSNMEPTMLNYVAFGLGGAFHLFLFNQLRQFFGQVLYSILIFMIVIIYYLYNNQLRELFFEDWVYGYMLLAAVVLALAYLLKRKAFPNLKYGGPKKDKNGEYIF